MDRSNRQLNLANSRWTESNSRGKSVYQPMLPHHWLTHSGEPLRHIHGYTVRVAATKWNVYLNCVEFRIEGTSGTHVIRIWGMRCIWSMYILIATWVCYGPHNRWVFVALKYIRKLFISILAWNGLNGLPVSSSNLFGNKLCWSLVELMLVNSESMVVLLSQIDDWRVSKGCWTGSSISWDVLREPLPIRNLSLKGAIEFRIFF